MDIQYLGHSCFKLRGKSGTLITDPYDKSTGLELPSLSADIVTVSHDHHDHNNYSVVTGTARRKGPFVITEAGEYEIEGVSVFGYQSYHDNSKGEERGENNVYIIQIDGVRVAHLGDLGHLLSDSLISEIDGVDVLMIPVGGVYTIGVKDAIKTIESISPSIVIPMHYKTNKHNSETFSELFTLEDFLKEYEGEVRKVEDKLSVSKLSLTEDSTEMVVFE